MEIYCLKCKKKTETTNSNEITTKNDRKMIKGQCKICNTNKNQFVKSNNSVGRESTPQPNNNKLSGGEIHPYQKMI